ncbi:sigma-70 family RNA polymerase sigma factor [Streptomyces sioyaensis]|uniref:sigma-70 family RNA polymerase sigma factor n=1 Tax=Streptomyces sioyaensis TaxID=67364 RepID=UPI00371331C2
MSDDETTKSGDLPTGASAAHREDLAGYGDTQRILDEEFSAFYRATVRTLIGFLANQGASLADAADIAQSSMLSAYQRWGDIEHPRAWIFTVASRALVRKVADVREDLVEEVPEPTSLVPRPDAVAEWECEHEALRIVRSLPARQRQILAWTCSGFTPSEIAEQLGMTSEAVRASLKKARRAATERVRKWEAGQ